MADCTHYRTLAPCKECSPVEKVCTYEDAVFAMNESMRHAAKMRDERDAALLQIEDVKKNALDWQQKAFSTEERLDDTLRLNSELIRVLKLAQKNYCFVECPAECLRNAGDDHIMECREMSALLTPEVKRLCDCGVEIPMDKAVCLKCHQQLR